MDLAEWTVPVTLSREVDSVETTVLLLRLRHRWVATMAFWMVLLMVPPG